ncbi:MAG: DUF5131 family protein [Ignavibacteria bacterium]|nr:DUF5131 family protein [Ignavibacteria bacterium]
MKYSWATAIRDQCFDNHTPFFFKQWGKRQPWTACRQRSSPGRMLDCCMHDAMPEVYYDWSSMNSVKNMEKAG